ncbi:squalene synthase [Tanacetum coccineum]
MESLKSFLTHPSDFYLLLKLKIAAKQAEKNIPTERNLIFCYAMLHKVSKSFAFVIQHLGNELRDAVCIFYLVLRALDTIEVDTSIDIETKIPILIEFHRLIYNPDWHFECGTKQCKVLMDQFYNVSKAFLELNERLHLILHIAKIWALQ